MWLHEVGMIVVGILCGSLLFSRYLPRKLKHVDVEALSQDHNPGTANAMKYAGVKVGILCLLGDIFKGTIPVHMAVHMGLLTGSLFPLIMAAPVFGHAYSLYHRGKGGKAIAVSFGVMIGLLPIHSELLVMLCALYLFFSLVVVIRPHIKRTRVTFFLFGCGAVGLTAMEAASLQICLGALLVAGIVVHKNSLKRQLLEESGTGNLPDVYEEAFPAPAVMGEGRLEGSGKMK